MGNKRSVAAKEVPQILYDHMVSVSAGDIEGATKRDVVNCPIARAMRASIFGNARAGALVAHFEYGGDWWVGELPLQAQRLIQDFDQGVPIEEMGFAFAVIRPFYVFP